MNITNFIKKIFNISENTNYCIFDFPMNNSIDLNSKVNEYLDWYKKFLFLKEENIPYEYPIMVNFIEKMAVWYELAYPDELLLDIIPSMYKNNDFYSKSLLPKEDFIKRLNGEEDCLLHKYKFPKIVYVDIRKYLTHFHLSEEGYINDVEDIADLDKTSAVIPPANLLIGKHLTEIFPLFKNKEILVFGNDLEKTIDNYRLETIRYEEMLNCVMYRLVERGGSRIGAYRAFLFALEFNRNIEIPIKYGYDSTDPKLRYLLNEYYKLGGSNDIICYPNYFNKEEEEPYEEQKLSALFSNQWLNVAKRYTTEEENLQQQLVNVLNNHAVNQQDQQLKLKKK